MTLCTVYKVAVMDSRLGVFLSKFYEQAVQQIHQIFLRDGLS